MNEPSSEVTEISEDEVKETELIKDVVESAGSIMHTWSGNHNLTSQKGHGVSIPEEIDRDAFEKTYKWLHQVDDAGLEYGHLWKTTFGNLEMAQAYEHWMGQSGIREALIVDKLAYSAEQGVPSSYLTKRNSPEASMRLTYLATEGIRDDLIALGSNTHYLDGQGRPGNKLALQIFIPWSIGERVKEMVLENPVFARKMVDGLVKQTYPKDFVDNTWEKYGKPPWGEWDKASKPQMIVDERWIDPRGYAWKNPKDGSDVRDFRTVPIKPSKGVGPSA